MVKVDYIWHLSILKRALWEAFLKLSPLQQFRNPVIFCVYISAILTAVIFIKKNFHSVSQNGFVLSITLWLWMTVLFANLAEAIAEGRGKAQAQSLSLPRADPHRARGRLHGGQGLMRSIRRRVLLLVLGLLSVTLTVISLTSYRDAQHEIAELFDAQLAQYARLLAGMVGRDMPTEARAALQQALDGRSR